MMISSLPGTVVGTQGGLAALGQAVQRAAPLRLYRIGLRRVSVGIQRGAPDPGDLLDIGRAALASLNLHRRHADGGELRDQIEGVEAGRLFQGMEALAIDQKAALAQGRVTGRLILAITVDQHAVEADRKSTR